jgi:O-antigen/teichoic acid export membrane protein
VTFAAGAAVVLLVVWLTVPASGGVDLRDLIWVVPFLPSLLVHDTGRYSYLADRRPERALVMDAVWVGTQAVCVVVVYTAGWVSAGGLFTCWGLGATAGATFFLVRSRIRPGLVGWHSGQTSKAAFGGSPRRWLSETRHLAGWFTATAMIGQFQGQAVGFLVAGQLSSRDLAALRGAQTTLLQPVQNFITAVMGLLVPRSSRLAAQGAAEGLRRQTRTLALSFAALGAVLVAVVVPLAHLVLAHIPKFVAIAPLALPIAIQPAIYLVQLPFAAALRGMHRARLLFAQYVCFTTMSLTGLVIGASVDRLPGAAWGLTTGSSVGLVVMVAFYEYAQRRLSAPPPPEPGAGSGSSPAEPGEVPSAPTTPGET